MTVCTFDNLIPRFLEYSQYELGRALGTVAKYKDALSWIVRDLNFRAGPCDLELDDITTLKRKMAERGAKESRVNGILNALKAFLNYCKTRHQLETLNTEEIKLMKIPNRKVHYLTPEEVKQLLDSFNVSNPRELRMKTLVAILVTTGMRISEALSLNKLDIDWENMEATIIGKGNKERIVYFTDYSLDLLKQYLAIRTDDNPALFVAFGTGSRWTQYDLSKQFKYYADKASLNKKVTPHILRHTMATTMLHNGADITFIRDLLGHSDIKTTAKYYLGTDQRAIKEAHAKYLQFDLAP